MPKHFQNRIFIIGFREQLSKSTYSSDIFPTDLPYLTLLQSANLEYSLIKTLGLPLPTTSPSYLEPAAVS